MLPAATYAAVVVPVETPSGSLPIQFGPGTEKSPFTAVLSFEILRGPQAGQHISAFLYFGEKSVDRSMESLRVCGFKGDDLDKFVDQTPDQEVQIVVEHETYNGQQRAKVKWINSPNRGFVFDQPLAQKDLRMFSAQMKTKLKTIKEVVGKPAVREAPTAETASDGPTEGGSGWSGNDATDPPAADDLPF